MQRLLRRKYMRVLAPGLEKLCTALMPARIRHMYQVYTKSYECTANATKTFSLILDSSQFRSENDHFNYDLSYKSR